MPLSLPLLQCCSVQSFTRNRLARLWARFYPDRLYNLSQQDSFEIQRSQRLGGSGRIDECGQDMRVLLAVARLIIKINVACERGVMSDAQINDD